MSDKALDVVDSNRQAVILLGKYAKYSDNY